MRRAGNDRLSRAVDAALELSIGGSFTRVGSALRRRLDRWDALDGVDLHGKVFVMTGATSGLGLEAARRFAKTAPWWPPGACWSWPDAGLGAPA